MATHGPSSDLPVFVYQSIESHAIPPAGGEIVDVDIGVSAKDRAQEQSLIIKSAFTVNSRSSISKDNEV